jgi:hypothetical protein
MATINIGNLAFTHKGDYDGSTAYAKNDVVYYSTNGNAYIAKQATTGNVPTNATYWNQFAAGSGGIWNAGLSLGSAGQFVKVNSGASALEFGDVAAAAVLKTETFSETSRNSYGGSGSYQTVMSGNFTKQSASSKITTIVNLHCWGESSGGGLNQFNLGTSSVEVGGHYGRTAHQSQVTQTVYISNNTQTGSLAWTFRVKNWGVQILNPNSSDHGNITSTCPSYITIIEHL